MTEALRPGQKSCNLEGHGMEGQGAVEGDGFNSVVSHLLLKSGDGRSCQAQATKAAH
jgi:hypothetical protein